MMPQPWAQIAMFCCVYAVLVQLIIVLLIPILTHEAEVSTDEHGNLDLSHVESGGMVATILSVVRYIIMLSLYGGFTTVIVAVCMIVIKWWIFFLILFAFDFHFRKFYFVIKFTF